MKSLGYPDTDFLAGDDSWPTVSLIVGAEDPRLITYQVVSLLAIQQPRKRNAHEQVVMPGRQTIPALAVGYKTIRTDVGIK